MEAGELCQDFWTFWVVCITSSVKLYILFPLAHAQRNESKKEVETGRFMFRLYLLKYLFGGEWGTEITDILMPKTLRWWKGPNFRKQNQRCVDLFRLQLAFWTPPPPHSLEMCVGPLTLLEGSKESNLSCILENVFPHVLFSALCYNQY